MAYNANEPRMSQREKELTAASNAGRRAYENNWSKALQFKVDPDISQAWDNGYRIAAERDGAVFKYAD